MSEEIKDQAKRLYDIAFEYKNSDRVPDAIADFQENYR